MKNDRKQALRAHDSVAIISPLQRKRSLIDERSEGNEGVDEMYETLHTLSSLLLTNTTIRKRSKAVPNSDL